MVFSYIFAYIIKENSYMVIIIIIKEHQISKTFRWLAGCHSSLISFVPNANHSHPIHWNGPPPAQCDGAWHQGSGVAACGGFFRDHARTVLLFLYAQRLDICELLTLEESNPDDVLAIEL